MSAHVHPPENVRRCLSIQPSTRPRWSPHTLARSSVTTFFRRWSFLPLRLPTNSALLRPGSTPSSTSACGCHRNSQHIWAEFAVTVPPSGPGCSPSTIPGIASGRSETDRLSSISLAESFQLRHLWTEQAAKRPGHSPHGLTRSLSGRSGCEAVGCGYTNDLVSAQLIAFRCCGVERQSEHREDHTESPQPDVALGSTAEGSPLLNR